MYLYIKLRCRVPFAPQDYVPRAKAFGNQSDYFFPLLFGGLQNENT